MPSRSTLPPLPMPFRAPMPRLFRPLLAVTLAAALSGCFQVRQVLRLDADGGGTVTEEGLFNAALMQTTGLFASFAQEIADDEAMEPTEEEVSARLAELADPFGEAAMRRRADALGARFVSVEPIRVLFGSGYRAVFAFDDVSELRLSGDPTTAMGSFMGEDGDDDPEALTMAWSGRTLTVTMPEDAEAEAEPAVVVYEDGSEPTMEEDPEVNDIDLEFADAAPDEPQDSAAALDEVSQLMQAMTVLRDIYYSLDIEGPSAIAETDAAHRDGARLTLFEFDFGALAEDEEAFAAFMRDNPDGPPSMGRLAAGELPGVRVQPQRTVTVRYE